MRKGRGGVRGNGSACRGHGIHKLPIGEPAKWQKMSTLSSCLFFEDSLRCEQARCGKKMYFAWTMAIHYITTRTVTMSVSLLLSNRYGSGRDKQTVDYEYHHSLCVGAKNVKKKNSFLHVLDVYIYFFR